MSALLVDLGNSRWKVAEAAAGGALAMVTSGEHQDLSTLRARIDSAVGMVTACYVSSVAPNAVTMRVMDILHTAFSRPAKRVVSTDGLPGLVSGYRDRNQLGIDRLLAMLAARVRTERAFCVVDAGTAVTVDFVDTAGQHLGGFILPGLAMSRSCLLANTAIPRAAEVEPGAVLGRDTATGVALGARNAVVGLVERFTRGSAALFPGHEVEIFVGGGDADVLVEMLPKPCTKLEHLVLEGLVVIAASEGC